MAWTEPEDFVTNEVVTASKLNQQLPANMSETAPAKATAEGELFEATGANALQATQNPMAVMVWAIIG